MRTAIVGEIMPDKETARDLQKAFICTKYKISPREFERLTVKDINLLMSYSSAVAEKQQSERQLNQW